MKLVLVGIGGPSSSGKTTVAKALHSLYPASTLVHLDDFISPDDQIPKDARQRRGNWDCADTIDWTKVPSSTARSRPEVQQRHFAHRVVGLNPQLKLSEQEKQQLSSLARTTWRHRLPLCVCGRVYVVP